MKKVASLLFMSIPFLCIILTNGNIKKYGYDLIASRPALVTCSGVILLYLLIKKLKGDTGYTAIGLSAMMVVGTLSTLLTPSLGQIFLNNMVPSLYLTLTLIVAVPPLLGLDSLTYKFTRKGRAPGLQAHPTFISVSNKMNHFLAGVLALTFISSVLPYSNALRGATPLAVMFCGMLITWRLPLFLLKREGGITPGDGLEDIVEGMPQKMRTLPVEQTIENEKNIVLPFESVTKLIDENESFLNQKCLCRSQEEHQGHKCDKPGDLCIGVSKKPNAFGTRPSFKGIPMNKEEAKEAIKRAEKEGLVHITHNYQEELYFICNCCGCCCIALKNIKNGRLSASTVINSNYIAKIDNDLCTMCGVCAKTRCQTGAVEEMEGAYKVMKENCIGCGLCVTTCPVKAITLEQKKEEDISEPPRDFYEWKELGDKVKNALPQA